MGNCLDLPSIRVRIRSNCCNADVTTYSEDEPDINNNLAELSDIPEEDNGKLSDDGKTTTNL